MFVRLTLLLLQSMCTMSVLNVQRAACAAVGATLFAPYLRTIDAQLQKGTLLDLAGVRNEIVRNEIFKKSA